MVRTVRTEIDDQPRELIDRLFHLIFFVAFFDLFGNYEIYLNFTYSPHSRKTIFHTPSKQQCQQ